MIPALESVYQWADEQMPDYYVKVSLDMQDYYKIKDEQKAKEEAK